MKEEKNKYYSLRIKKYKHQTQDQFYSRQGIQVVITFPCQYRYLPQSPHYFLFSHEATALKV